MLADGDAPHRDVHTVYDYFCREANGGKDASDPTRVAHFHAYMLQAELKNTSNVSKRLLHAHQCASPGPASP